VRETHLLTIGPSITRVLLHQDINAHN